VEELLLMRALKGETIEHAEVWIKQPAPGVEKYITVSARPVRDSTGNITAAIADFRDKTPEVQLEKLFRDLEKKYNELIESPVRRKKSEP
jgi:hypothetical protein